ncbi:unnamed protein product [Menidia menidia]|uniref:(Atlantic silverside) hypothetical protein n=1 Tax=Menidia menidia TaxID=238744 RepID=A0A8S4AIZ2_9TELE|nr:unnamed protein product [Menidia menidia]
MVYYSLGNINPKFRSKLTAIRLLAITKSNDVSKCGVDAILKRFLKDLLYNAVKIKTHHGEMDFLYVEIHLFNMSLQALKKVLALPKVNADTVNATLRICK